MSERGGEYKVIESDFFRESRRQLEEGKGGGKRIGKDIDKAKEFLKENAFCYVPNVNKPVKSPTVLVKGNRVKVWYMRVRNSSRNKSMRAGYRVFYCREDDSVILLVAIAQKGGQKIVTFMGGRRVTYQEVMQSVKDWH